MANASRLKLHEILCDILGTRNVYYDPPESLRMEYDAIRYSLDEIKTTYANNAKYSSKRCYNVILISRTSDPEVLDKLLELPFSDLGRPYVSDNLHHYPITLYY